MSPPGFDPLSLPYYDPEIDRRVAFITGGNSGIGWYTVLELFLHGYVVYIAGRSKNRVLKSIKEIRERAATIRESYTDEERETRFLGEVFFLEADLLNLKSVTAAVDTFKSVENYLNILVNNAGVMALPYAMTKCKLIMWLLSCSPQDYFLTSKTQPTYFPHLILRGSSTSVPSATSLPSTTST